MHIHVDHLDNSGSIMGFATETKINEGICKVLTRATFTSDEQEFYNYTDQLSDIFLTANNIIIDTINRFLILIHKDFSADIYLNEFKTEMEICPKCNVEKGQLIQKNDILDIRRIRFPEIEILETDKMVYCFKVGWKFGLFFDLAGDGLMDLDKAYLDIGKLERKLLYCHLYKLLDSQNMLEEMQNDGWFPFVEIMNTEFKDLMGIYKDKIGFEERIDNIVSRFDKERIESITDKWWNNEYYFNKQSIIKAGINSYLLLNKEGYISCIKNIITEVEGILRLNYYQETNKGRIKIKDLLNYLVNKCDAKFGHKDSLLFTNSFFNYLNNVIFSQFDLEKNNVALSRHSSSHGVAKPDDYTKIRALQMILILDQLYFYL